MAAAIGGAFISLLLAVFAIRYLVDQVVIGVVLNLFALGVTGFLYERLMQTDADRYNSRRASGNWEIPLLKDIPLLGPALFRGNIFLYLGLLLVLIIHLALFRTRWGLRTRSVGEHPTAADTLGHQGAAACATATCCWPGWSPASAARSTPWRSTASTRT